MIEMLSQSSRIRDDRQCTRRRRVRDLACTRSFAGSCRRHRPGPDRHARGGARPRARPSPGGSRVRPQPGGVMFFALIARWAAYPGRAPSAWHTPAPRRSPSSALEESTRRDGRAEPRLRQRARRDRDTALDSRRPRRRRAPSPHPLAKELLFTAFDPEMAETMGDRIQAGSSSSISSSASSSAQRQRRRRSGHLFLSGDPGHGGPVLDVGMAPPTASPFSPR